MPPGARTSDLLFVVGTRAPVDGITSFDRGRLCHWDPDAPDDVWTDLDGRPL